MPELGQRDFHAHSPVVLNCAVSIRDLYPSTIPMMASDLPMKMLSTLQRHLNPFTSFSKFFFILFAGVAAYYVLSGLYKTFIYFSFISPYKNLPGPARQSYLRGNLKPIFEEEPGVAHQVRPGRLLLDECLIVLR